MYFITNSNTDVTQSKKSDTNISQDKKLNTISKKKIIIGVSTGLVIILSLGIYFAYFNEHSLIRELKDQDYRYAKEKLSKNLSMKDDILEKIEEQRKKTLSKLSGLLVEKCNKLKDLTIITKMLKEINDSLKKYNTNLVILLSIRLEKEEYIQKEINNSPRNSKNIIDKIYELFNIDQVILLKEFDPYYKLDHVNVYYKFFNNILST